MSSLCCHFNWEKAGSGRIGNGGVGASSCHEIANLNRRKSVVIRHKEHRVSDIMLAVLFLLSSSFCFLFYNVGEDGRGTYHKKKKKKTEEGKERNKKTNQATRAWKKKNASIFYSLNGAKTNPRKDDEGVTCHRSFGVFLAYKQVNS